MMLIGAFFVAASTLYQCMSSRRGPTPADIVNDILPGKEENLNVTGQDGAELRQGEVILDTAFSSDWTVTSNENGKILTNKDRVSICQSYVVPIADYNRLVEKSGTIEQALQDTMEATLKLIAPPGAGFSARTTPLFNEIGPPARIGNRLEGSITMGARSSRQVQIVVWTFNERYAANLNCARVNADASDTSLLERMARAYRFKQG